MQVGERRTWAGTENGEGSLSHTLHRPEARHVWAATEVRDLSVSCAPCWTQLNCLLRAVARRVKVFQQEVGGWQLGVETEEMGTQEQQLTTRISLSPFLPALHRELCPGHLLGRPGGRPGLHPRRRWRRTLLVSRSDADHHQDGSRQRRRQAHCRRERHHVDSRSVPHHPLEKGKGRHPPHRVSQPWRTQCRLRDKVQHGERRTRARGCNEPHL